MLLETQSALLHTTQMRLLGLLSFKKGKKHHECVIKVYMIMIHYFFKYTTIVTLKRFIMLQKIYFSHTVFFFKLSIHKKNNK